MENKVDTFKLAKMVSLIEQNKLNTIISAIGGEYTFDVDNDDNCPIIGMLGSNTIANPFDIVVKRLYFNENKVLMIEGHVVEGEDGDFVADEIIPGQVTFILDMLPNVELPKNQNLTRNEILLMHNDRYVDVAQEISVECLVKMQELDVCQSDREKIKALIREWSLEFMKLYGNYDYTENPKNMSYYDLIDEFVSQKMKAYV